MSKLFSPKYIYSLLLIIIVVLLALLIGVTYFLIDSIGSIRYLPALLDPEPTAVCHYKKFIWGHNEYPLNTSDKDKRFLLKVENINKDYWNYLLQALSSEDMIGEFNLKYEDLTNPVNQKKLNKRYIYCTASIYALKDPKQAPKDMVERAKGTIISLGFNDKNGFHKISELTLAISLQAYRFTDEAYNFDAAMKYIADNYRLIRLSNGILELKFTGDFKSPKAFYYEFAQVNGKPVNGLFVNFTSKDNGKTWTPVVVSKN